MEKDTHDFLQEVRNHRHRLEKRITDHMKMDEGARSTSSLGDMLGCWERLQKAEKDMSHCTLTQKDLHKWVEGMKNMDGTTGPHWTLEQTTSVAKANGVLIGHVSYEDFWAAMNMMYSDYSAVADKFGMNRTDFFAELAKAFLFDKDEPRPEEKLAAYYRGVVCAEK